MSKAAAPGSRASMLRMPAKCSVIEPAGMGFAPCNGGNRIAWVHSTELSEGICAFIASNSTVAGTLVDMDIEISL